MEFNSAQVSTQHHAHRSQVVKQMKQQIMMKEIWRIQSQLEILPRKLNRFQSRMMINRYSNLLNLHKYLNQMMDPQIWHLEALLTRLNQQAVQKNRRNNKLLQVKVNLKALLITSQVMPLKQQTKMVQITQSTQAQQISVQTNSKQTTPTLNGLQEQKYLKNHLTNLLKHSKQSTRSIKCSQGGILNLRTKKPKWSRRGTKFKWNMTQQLIS